MGRESQLTIRYVGRDSNGQWRDQLDAGLQEANAEIQSGNYLSRIDRPNDFARGVIHRVRWTFQNGMPLPHPALSVHGN
jgi:hypothetical protein